MISIFTQWEFIILSNVLRHKSKEKLDSSKWGQKSIDLQKYTTQCMDTYSKYKSQF